MTAITSIRQYVLAKMAELGIEPKKSLGQNFLISDHVVGKIISTVKDLPKKNIIEIGPGLGSLTQYLIDIDPNLQVIELDSTFAKHWKEKGLLVHEADALQWKWQDLPSPSETLLVSNLPYQISSSLVIDRSLDIKPLSGMVLMFQKEVAQRLKAARNTEAYGMLSVVAQTFWDIDTLLEASSGDFMPPPKVASRVLVFKSKVSPVQDKKNFLRFMKACFSQPRKMMISNMSSSLKISKEQLGAIFEGQKLNVKARAQELSLQQFLALYQALGYK